MLVAEPSVTLRFSSRRFSNRPGNRATPEVAEEARVLARVTGTPPFLLDDEEECVHVAVVRGATHVLAITRRLTFAPELTATPAPEPGTTGLEGAAQRLAVHPPEHQHLTRRF